MDDIGSVCGDNEDIESISNGYESSRSARSTRSNARPVRRRRGGRKGPVDDTELDSGAEEENPFHEARVTFAEHPLFVEIRKLGTPDPKEKCAGCFQLRGRALTMGSSWEMLHTSAFMGYISGDWVDTSKKLEDLFENGIKLPSNESIQPGQLPWPSWTAATILDHYLYHIHDPRVRQAFFTSILFRMAIDQARYNCYETVEIPASRPGRRPTRISRPINAAKPHLAPLKMMQDAMKLYLDAAKVDCSKDLAHYSSGSVAQISVDAAISIEQAPNQEHRMLEAREKNNANW